ncbi:MAG: hypothetical protein WC460_02025 [Patescibacteria group bacterium]
MMPEIVQNACISDGNNGLILVQPGDRVALLPTLFERREGRCDIYRAKDDFMLLREWLGEDPFTISWIGKWPCGKIVLYLNGTKVNEPEVDAKNFYRDDPRLEKRGEN